MNSARKDPLLMAAKIITIIARIVLVIGMIGCGIGMAALAVGAAGWLPENVIVEMGMDHNPAPLWAAALAVFGALVALGLSYEFVKKLAQVIDTVGEGDPFSLANAARITSMAWLALGVQAISFIASLLGNWADTHMEGDNFQWESDFSLTGIALALVLFILARVFREGARMQIELEGTV